MHTATYSTFVVFIEVIFFVLQWRRKNALQSSAGKKLPLIPQIEYALICADLFREYLRNESATICREIDALRHQRLHTITKQ